MISVTHFFLTISMPLTFHFSSLIDTKVLSSSDDFKDVIKSTVLGDVVAVIQKEPFNIPEIHNSEHFSLQMDSFHDAAFDSFCTGVSFLALGQFLFDKFKPNETNFTMDSSILTSFKNKYISVQELYHKRNF